MIFYDRVYVIVNFWEIVKNGSSLTVLVPNRTTWISDDCTHILNRLHVRQAFAYTRFKENPARLLLNKIQN